MNLFGDAARHCKRCQYELEGGEATCPRCQFSPRAKGLRVALLLLALMTISITGVMIVPIVGPLLVRVAAVSFVLAFFVIVISFLATPHRFGSVFLRL